MDGDITVYKSILPRNSVHVVFPTFAVSCNIREPMHTITVLLSEELGACELPIVRIHTGGLRRSQK